MQTLTPLIAHASGWHHGGWWIVFPFLWLVLATFVVAVFWRRGHGPRRDGDSPRRILGERFARGEISADEYRDRLGQLR
jgi:putative membrane protein